MEKELRAPESLSVSLGEINGEVNLQWDTVERANNYVVEYSFMSKRIKWQQVDFVPVSRCVITGLKQNKTYMFRVAALNCTTQSKWSNIVNKKIL